MCYDAVKLSIRCQQLGVVRGLKTGSMFFEIYYSDFARMCSDDGSILYEYNIILVNLDTNLKELTEHVNSRLRNILDWCNYNNLFSKYLKPEFIAVTNKRRETHQQLFIGTDYIKEVKSFKYLGVYIDTRLTNNVRIKNLKIKVS